MNPIILSGIGAVVGAVVVGKFTKYWIYKGVHSLLGSLILVACIALVLMYGNFDTLIGISIGCGLAFGVASALGALGRAYDKYSVNSHITIALLIFGITFIL